METTTVHPHIMESALTQESTELENVAQSNFRTFTEPNENNNLANVNSTDNDARRITGLRWLMTCIALYSCPLLYGLDTTIAAVVQADVIEDFSDASKLGWRFNMRWTYYAGFFLFILGTFISGFARNMVTLIVGRVLAGAGGTGIYLGGLSYFAETTTRHQRGAYMAGSGLAWGLGAILGPVVGGVFSNSGMTWRWSFYLILIMGIPILPFLFFLPSIHPETDVPIHHRLARLDYLGFVLFASMWTTFAVGFMSAGEAWSWNDAAPTPRLLITFYIPIYFQFTQNDSSLMAAVRLLPFLLILVAVNSVTGWALPKLKYYMPFCTVSGLLMTIASTLFVAFLSRSISTGQIYGFSIIMAIGSGITMQLGYTVTSLPEESDKTGAMILQNIAQIGSSVVCLVIASQGFQTNAIRNLDAVLAGIGFNQTDIMNAVTGAQSTLFQSLSGEMREAAIKAIIQAISRTFIVALVAGILCSIASLETRARIYT
ncbi:MFS general substrate transporter [Aspergillus ellipticus CBS 707.79]|uniref:MFS general substrate transporter n=1 Tax=Aspergillus ellipticus CBS 707.79 TaxID=1448320 RepID=A0A319D5V7_9EURO|nr:MFS general substrate transporter [Aspergillus ellipticus CBS 707.79]